MKKFKPTVDIKNRKASFNFEFIEEEIAGISLFGSEVKSIRAGNASIAEAHCYIHDEECFIKGMYVAEYKESGRNGHDDPYRNRKLLLTKKQIRKWDKELKTKGNTIVPIRIFIQNGKLKLKIALARGKKQYDKREDLKKKDMKRDTERELKG